MSVLQEYMAIMARLEMAVDDALDTEVAEAARTEMSRQVHERVYDAYTPQDPATRRMDSGGLSDVRNYDARVEAGHMLTVENNTPMQHPDGGNLTEIVEQGRAAYRMPFPRPFVEAAEQTVNAGWALAQGLRRNGFSVTYRID